MLYFYINSTERGSWSLTGPYGVTRYAFIFHSFIFPEYILPSALCTLSLSLVEGGSKNFDWSQNRSRLECSVQAMLCSTQHCTSLPWVLLSKEKSCFLGKSPFPRIHVAIPWKSLLRKYVEEHDAHLRPRVMFILWWSKRKKNVLTSGVLIYTFYNVKIIGILSMILFIT